MGINVLFIYPNTFGMNMLPPAIATFSAILKQHNHQVQVFDTTYYAVDYGIDSDGSKEERLNVIPFSKEMRKRNMRIKDTSWKDDLKNQITKFKPDLIALSATEDMWELGIKILEEIKEYKIKNNIPVIAGGVFPTFAPTICIKYDLIEPYVLTANEHAGWKYDIVAAESCQVTRYTKDGYYSWHRDGMGSHNELHNDGNTRKLSMSIILNSDFEGGDFEMRGLKDKVPRLEEGSIIVFPSFMDHRVVPITKGIRYSLVAWFLGPPFI